VIYLLKTLHVAFMLQLCYSFYFW